MFHVHGRRCTQLRGSTGIESDLIALCAETEVNGTAVVSHFMFVPMPLFMQHPYDFGLERPGDAWASCRYIQCDVDFIYLWRRLVTEKSLKEREAAQGRF